MVHIYSFQTLDKIIEDSSKLTKKDRYTLVNSQHILDYHKILNIKFENYLIGKS